MSMVFVPGEAKVRPGVFVRVTNIGDPPSPTVPMGIVAVPFKASWGPLGEAQPIDGGFEAFRALYGEIGIAREAFRGGAATVLAYRMGASAETATVTLKDGAAADAVKIEAKYPGARGNGFSVTVRDSLADTTKRELIVYEGTTKLQTVVFAKGAAEPAALVTAVGESPYVTATKIADGDGTLAAVAQSPLAGGTDPTPTADDLSAALTALEPEDWNVLAVETEDTAMQATIQTYIARVRADGKFVTAVLAEPTSVALADRFAHSKAFNDPAIVYVANGFTAAGESVEGALAAGRAAGMIASGPVTRSLTHAVVQGATGLVGALTNSQVVEAVEAGALVFTMSRRNQVQIEYGINTLVTPAADQDAGWKKIRRVRTRDTLMARIIAGWEPLIGQVNNDENGRATLIAVANGVIQQMVAEGALLGGLCQEDPANPPAGDSAWFTIQVDDLDSAEHVYLTFGFRFSA